MLNRVVFCWLNNGSMIENGRRLELEISVIEKEKEEYLRTIDALIYIIFSGFQCHRSSSVHVQEYFVNDGLLQEELKKQKLNSCVFLVKR